MTTLLETAPKTTSVYIPSPTVEEFIHATAVGSRAEMRVLILMAARGEGKTTGAVAALLALANRMQREGLGAWLPIRVAVVRDTWTNLERTTLVSLAEFKAKGLPLEFVNSKKEALITYDRLLLHFFFFGLDNRADADKLQGFACGALWLEEVAPAAELATGIPAEVLGLGATAVRQEGVPPRVLCTLNPPDEDHWILRVEELLEHLNLTEVRVKRFVIPSGEKSRHFATLALAAETENERTEWEQAAKEFDAYRKRNQAFLESIGRPDLVARLVKGEIGGVTLGEAVVPNFKSMHVSEEPLPVYPGEIMRGWDIGMTVHPATCFLQLTPAGNLNILGSVVSTNKSTNEHILDEVLPWQQEYDVHPPRTMTGEGFGRGSRGGYRFRDIGDPSGLVKEQGLTAAMVLQSMLGASYEPGPVSWIARREALHTAFHRTGSGDRSLILIDHSLRRDGTRNNDILVKGLRGRFHYAVNLATGRIDPSVEAAKKVSGIFSHPVDALAYPLAVLFPAEEWLKKAQQVPVPSVRLPKAKSWIGV